MGEPAEDETLELPDEPVVLPARPDIVALVDDLLRRFNNRGLLTVTEIEDVLLDIRRVASQGVLE